MILKEKDAYVGADERGFYGHKQEQDVAFHLRREFGNTAQIRIIHDLVIEHGGERAQIDHLVIHPYGFITIESKSIVGEVQVNADGEWSRSYKGNWSGIASPIRQAELQLDLLRTLLRENVEQLLGRVMGIQEKFGGRDWQVLCAVSSTAILHREMMPKTVARKVVKTEFVAKKVQEMVGNIVTEYLKAKPKFSMQEIENISNFLLEHDTQLQVAAQRNQFAEQPSLKAVPVKENAPLSFAGPEITAPSADSDEQIHHLLSCKQCGDVSNLTGMYGQYGYYVKCASCNTNTSMKQPCPACGWKSVKIAKDGPSYTATCRKCDHQYLVYRQG